MVLSGLPDGGKYTYLPSFLKKESSKMREKKVKIKYPHEISANGRGNEMMTIL